MTYTLEDMLRFILDADEARAEKLDPACQALLSAYIDAELAGEDAAALFPAVQACLEESAAFAERYAELKGLLFDAQRERLVEPPAPAEFDFSYLEPVGEPGTAPARRWWYVNAAGHLMISVTEELLRASLAAVKKASDLAAAADAPALALAGQLRSVRETVPLVSLDEEMDDLAVQITLESRPPSDYCAVIVSVDIPSRGGWPHLADVEVTLRRSEDLIGRQYTDPFGKVAFVAIDIDHVPELNFEIAP